MQPTSKFKSCEEELQLGTTHDLFAVQAANAKGNTAIPPQLHEEIQSSQVAWLLPSLAFATMRQDILCPTDIRARINDATQPERLAL